MKFTIENVQSFQGFAVENGEVILSDSQWIDVLDEIYGDVEVCGFSYSSGSILQDQDPVAFRCGRGDYESALQAELEDQLENEDDSGIEFVDDDLDDDDEMS